MGIGVLGLIILIVATGFVGYNFYTHKTKPFQFHYFKAIIVYASCLCSCLDMKAVKVINQV